MRPLHAAILGVLGGSVFFVLAARFLPPEDTANKSATVGWIAMGIVAFMIGLFIFARGADIAKRKTIWPRKRL